MLSRIQYIINGNSARNFQLKKLITYTRKKTNLQIQGHKHDIHLKPWHSNAIASWEVCALIFSLIKRTKLYTNVKNSHFQLLKIHAKGQFSCSNNATLHEKANYVTLSLLLTNPSCEYLTDLQYILISVKFNINFKFIIYFKLLVLSSYVIVI